MYYNLLISTLLLLSTIPYASATWVAVGGTHNPSGLSNGVILTSDNGNNWHRVDLPENFIFLNSVATDNTGKWVTVGLNENGVKAVIFYSANLNDWRAVTAPAGKNLVSVAYGNGKWVAVGEQSGSIKPLILFSTDGINWSSASLNLPSELGHSALETVAYGNGTWVAAGGGVTLVSTDAINWTAYPDPSWQWPLVNDVTYNHNLWMGAGIMSTDSSAITTSFDGISWNLTTIPTACYFTSVIYGNSQWLVMGRTVRPHVGPCIYTSQDAMHWSSLSPGLNSANMNSVAYANGQWIAVGDENHVELSQDNGATWINLPITTIDTLSLQKVVYSSN